jgi:hypothetical protein
MSCWRYEKCLNVGLVQQKTDEDREGVLQLVWRLCAGTVTVDLFMKWRKSMARVQLYRIYN